ncbi:MAG TPA: DUF6289 family protein [Thermoanaerobaculia bacterium]
MKLSTVPSVVRKAALAAGVAGLTFFAASTTSAAPAGNCTYYSSASKTQVVGQFGKDCCNNTVAWGVRTSYYQCSQACFLCVPPPQ